MTETWDQILERFPKNRRRASSSRFPPCVPTRSSPRTPSVSSTPPAGVWAAPGEPVDRTTAGERRLRRPRAAALGGLAAARPLRLMAEVAREPGREPANKSLLDAARRTRGFMPDDEGEALYEAALPCRGGRGAPERSPPSWRSAPGAGSRRCTSVPPPRPRERSLFSIDHHHGSEENQPGWDHHDPELVDPDTGRIDTLPFWRRTIAAPGSVPSVVGIVGDSPTIAARWRPRSTSASSTAATARSRPGPTTGAGRRTWRVGGWLAIHDVFPDPADGGRPPYELWRAALDSGEFVEDGECGSLRVLRRGRPPRRPGTAQPAEPRAAPLSDRRGAARGGVAAGGSVRSRPPGSDSPRNSPAAGWHRTARRRPGRWPPPCRWCARRGERLLLGIDDPRPVRAVGAAVACAQVKSSNAVVHAHGVEGERAFGRLRRGHPWPVDTQRTPRPSITKVSHHASMRGGRPAERRRTAPGSTSPWRTRAWAEARGLCAMAWASRPAASSQSGRSLRRGLGAATPQRRRGRSRTTP